MMNYEEYFRREREMKRFHDPRNHPMRIPAECNQKKMIAPADRKRNHWLARLTDKWGQLKRRGENKKGMQRKVGGNRQNASGKT